MNPSITFEYKTTHALFIIALTLLTTAFFYRLQGKIERKYWLAILHIRMLAMIILLTLILKPSIRIKKHLEDLKTSVLIDISGSMAVADMQAERRIDYVKKKLAENADLIKKLPNTDIFLFATTLQKIEQDEIPKIETASADIMTDITRALEDLTEREESPKREHHIVLITDGNHLAAEDPIRLIEEKDLIVYPISVGREDTPGIKNLSLRLKNPPLKFLTDAENIITVELEYQNVQPKEKVNIKANLNGKKLTQKSIVLKEKEGITKVELPVRPQRAGRVLLEIKADVLDDERVSSDNECLWQGIAIDKNINICIIEGHIRPETKFLKQLLRANPSLQFVSLTQIREDKFLINRSSDKISLNKLPKSKEELDTFDVFILSDISDKTLSKATIEALKEQITQDGKGLLIIAGSEISDWPEDLKEVIPAKIGKDLKWIDIQFKAHLTLLGRKDPVFEGIEELFESKAYFKGLFVPVGKEISDIALVEKDKQNPIFLKKIYGKGKVYLLLSPQSWRWSLNPNKDLQRLYNRFWLQLLQTLSNKEIGKLPQEVLIINAFPTSSRAHDKVRIVGYIFDQSSKPIRPEVITLKLIPPTKGREKKFDLIPEIKEDYFTAEITPSEEGRYTISAETQLKNTVLKGSTYINSYKISDELIKVSLNKRLLEKIADAGKTGRIRHIDELPSVLEDIISYYKKYKTKAEYFRVELFDYRIYLMILLITLITIELTIRYRLRIY